MTRRDMLVDEKCYDLADTWLSGEDCGPAALRKRLTLSLARQIQQAIEDWMMDERDSERDEAYERAAARARNNDFAETGGKDWT